MGAGLGIEAIDLHDRKVQGDRWIDIGGKKGPALCGILVGLERDTECLLDIGNWTLNIDEQMIGVFLRDGQSMVSDEIENALVIGMVGPKRVANWSGDR